MDGLTFAAQIRNRCDELLRLYGENLRAAEFREQRASPDDYGPTESIARAEGAIEALTSLRESVTGW